MVATKMSVTELATEFAKLVSGSPADPRLAQSMAPELKCWHNHLGEVTMLKAMGLTDRTDNPLIVVKGDEYPTSMTKNYQLMQHAMPEFRTEDLRIHVAESSFVVTYALVATPPGGATVRTERCAVVTVEDGLLSRVDYYEDPAAIQQMSQGAPPDPEMIKGMIEATKAGLIRVGEP